ncbi:RNA polymerase sigma factor [Pedobacter heparinus]|uniref:RNA polymerase sigma-70 factor n=1 Tax=Pedobacter heparinus (strain ATCC 13125 / DSM 2366 / CIP 104194 / JCM 7457 / NBRC 12017 / NCIMB 9290 / NRRL B-14731 / HIM 762-3) TaxID=485917 RepID=C6XYS8_PEDHD|nr:RNA polymerase sigma-70 factor [Pedobacter heparinus]ACU04560.1 RNA polymerase sigma-70 factor [Pedobacter heparinus DSM 2366]
MANKTSLDEQELLLALKKGEVAAFEEIYKRYKQRLAVNFLKLLRSEELAQDALQDLFIKIWTLRKSIDPDKSFQAYLFKIAQNIVFDFYRKAARDKKMQLQMLLENEDFYSHIEENLASKDNISLVHELIAQLPPQQQKVFTMFKLEEKSYKEISILLGISPSTINKHVHQANKVIKAELQSRIDIQFVIILSALLASTN